MRHEPTRIGSAVQPSPEQGPSCLVTIYGLDLGRRWMLDRPTLLIGRDESCDLVIDLDNVSRRHCEIVSLDDGAHQLRDLDSRNGTYVNREGRLAAPRTLASGDLIKVGGAVFKYLDGVSLESQFHEAIYRMTITDGLTQAYNKRFLLDFLQREMARSHRYGRSLSLMMIDLDHFKRVNDEHGHIAGDHVLREVVQVIARSVRKEECLARYGGEELALVMPEAEPRNVRIFAEKIRSEVAASPFRFEGREIPVTLSIGIARMTPQMADPTTLVSAADDRLYEAKRAGRNRVVD